MTLHRRLTPIFRRREHLFRLMVGFFVGTVCGLAAFGAARLSGLALFLVVGALTGTAAALAFHRYGSSASLTEVKIIIPRFSELRFTVDRDSRGIAWKLFVETVTRISFQTLKQTDGLLRESMNSLYILFQNVRNELSTARPTPSPGKERSVAELAIAMLNLELRPFLAHWHPRLKKWEQDNEGKPEELWLENSECRADLERLQERMRAYVVGYAKIAGVNDVEVLIGTQP